MSDHVQRFSDSSAYDFVCINCGHTDETTDLDRTRCPCPEEDRITLEEHYRRRKEHWDRLMAKPLTAEATCGPVGVDANGSPVCDESGVDPEVMS